MFEGGLTGPGDVGSIKPSSLSNFLSEIMDADVSQMEEKDYLRFVKITGQIKRVIYKQAVDNNDSRMHEIAHKMLLSGTNPFSHPDIAEIVREMLNK
jgi:phospholipid N-methyltransferase